MQPHDSAPVLSRRAIYLMAAGSGLTVANIYYNQPLLRQMAESFGVSEAQAGYIPALTQAGYALGLLLFVPLGDLFERRSLVGVMLMGAVCSLLAVAVSPTFPALAGASFALGMLGITPQLLVPFAAHLARLSERGRVVGAVMSGLLVGILLARTVSGFMGHQFGWRSIYWLAAPMMVGLLLMIRSSLPQSRPTHRLSYPRLMTSLVELVRDEPVVRQSCLMGAGTFGAFSAFWSTLTFHLAQPPYGYGSEIVGLFGVIGVVGVAAAPLAGRFGDTHDPRLSLGFGLIAMLLSFLIFWAGASSLGWMVVGVIVLDLGAQVAHISNQARIYALRPEARSRLVTVYMVTSFVGGGLGAFLAAKAWSNWHWSGVCAVAASMLLFSLTVFIITAPALGFEAKGVEDDTSHDAKAGGE